MVCEAGELCFRATFLAYNFSFGTGGCHFCAFKGLLSGCGEVEFENLYLKDRDPYGVLKYDFNNTPIILGLDETANPPIPLFYTEGASKNIYFMSVTDN